MHLHAMHLHAQTLFVVLALAVTLAALVLWVASLRNPEIRALRYWAISYVVGAIGVYLLILRGDLPDFLSIDIGNGIMLASFGLAWSSIRVFQGRSPRWEVALAGAAVWLVACRFPGFYESTDVRVAFASFLHAGYSLAGSVEFWRSRDAKAWRIATTGLTAVHGSLYLARGILVVLFPPTSPEFFLNYGLAAVALESVLFCFAGAFFILMIAKERVEKGHRDAAMIDPLTGVANRRAFLAEAEHATGSAARRGQGAALILFDLDRFKSINDTWGHAMGDQVLELFCAVVSANLRAGDRFGRLGGEEFGALLPDIGETEALAIAQRVLDRFAEAATRVGGRAVEATTSAGLALAYGEGDLHDLMRRADRALYRAKDLGRNRVEEAPAGRRAAARAA